MPECAQESCEISLAFGRKVSYGGVWTSNVRDMNMLIRLSYLTLLFSQPARLLLLLFIETVETEKVKNKQNHRNQNFNRNENKSQNNFTAVRVLIEKYASRRFASRRLCGGGGWFTNRLCITQTHPTAKQQQKSGIDSSINKCLITASPHRVQRGKCPKLTKQTDQFSEGASI